MITHNDSSFTLADVKHLRRRKMTLHCFWRSNWDIRLAIAFFFLEACTAILSCYWVSPILEINFIRSRSWTRCIVANIFSWCAIPYVRLDWRSPSPFIFTTILRHCRNKAIDKKQCDHCGHCYLERITFPVIHDSLASLVILYDKSHWWMSNCLDFLENNWILSIAQEWMPSITYHTHAWLFDRGREPKRWPRASLPQQSINPCEMRNHPRSLASAGPGLGRTWNSISNKIGTTIKQSFLHFANHPRGWINTTTYSSTNLLKHAFANWSGRRCEPISFCSITEMGPRSSCITIGLHFPDISTSWTMLKKNWGDNPHRITLILIATDINPSCHISCFYRKMSQDWQSKQAQKKCILIQDFSQYRAFSYSRIILWNSKWSARASHDGLGWRQQFLLGR